MATDVRLITSAPQPPERRLLAALARAYSGLTQADREATEDVYLDVVTHVVEAGRKRQEGGQ